MSGPPFPAFLHSSSSSSSSSNSCGTHDNNLVDCMPEEDRAALLPILKIAFPFMKCPPPSADGRSDGDEDGVVVAGGAQEPLLLHFHQQQLQEEAVDDDDDDDDHEEGGEEDARVAEMVADCSNNNNSSSSSIRLLVAPQRTAAPSPLNPRPPQLLLNSCATFFSSHSPMPPVPASSPSSATVAHGSRNCSSTFIPNTSSSSSSPPPPPPSLSLPTPPPSSLHAHDHPSFLLHSDIKTHHPLDSDPSAFLGSAFHDSASNFDALLPDPKIEHHNDASSNVTDDKLSLSLASAPSDGDVLNTNSGLSMANLAQSHECVSPEASCVHPPENESFLDHEVSCKDEEALRMAGHSENVASVDNELDVSRKFGCDKPPTVPSSAAGIHRISDSENSLDLNNCAERDTIDDCLMELETKGEMYDFSEDRAMASHCSPNSLPDHEPESERKNGRTTDVLSQLSSSGGNNQSGDTKPEQCRRSNGKQWQCRRNATPGMMYCEFHQDYRRKGRADSPNGQGAPKQVSCPGTPEISGGSVTKIASGNDLVVQKREIDRSRCHRNDGKLWQCAKSALPGSIYCEHHHTKRHKKTKKESGTRRSDNKQASSVPLDGGDRGSFRKHALHPEHHLNDPNAAFTSLKSSDADADTNRSNKRRHDGLVRESGSKVPRSHAYSVVSGCDGTGIATIQNDGQNDASQSILLGSHLGPWNPANGGDSDMQKPPERCHRKDGKKWQCAKFCVPGFSYCEYHQGRLRKSKIVVKENLKSTESAGGQPFAQGRLPEARNAESSFDQQKETVEDVGDFEENVNVLLQCQRKDGKGWQCSQHSKPGFKYCEHHLGFSMSRQCDVQMLDCPLLDNSTAEQERSSSVQTFSSCHIDPPSTVKRINMESGGLHKRHHQLAGTVNYQNDAHLSMMSHQLNFGSYPNPMTHIAPQKGDMSTSVRSKDHAPAVAATQMPHKSLYPPATCNTRREETFSAYDAFSAPNVYSLLQQQGIRNVNEPSLFAGGGNASYPLVAFRGAQMQGMYNAQQFSQGLYNVYQHSREPYYSSSLSSPRLPSYCKGSTKVPGVPPDVENGS